MARSGVSKEMRQLRKNGQAYRRLGRYEHFMRTEIMSSTESALGRGFDWVPWCLISQEITKNGESPEVGNEVELEVSGRSRSRDGRYVEYSAGSGTWVHCSVSDDVREQKNLWGHAAQRLTLRLVSRIDTSIARPLARAVYRVAQMGRDVVAFGDWESDALRRYFYAKK